MNIRNLYCHISFEIAVQDKLPQLNHDILNNGHKRGDLDKTRVEK